MNEQTDKNDKSYLPPHQYSTEEAIERAKILTAPDAPGFDKPWALAIMRGLLAGLDTPPSATLPITQHRYSAPFKMYGKETEWVQTRFVSRDHIKDSPTEANPSPIRVILLGDLERAQPHAMAFDKDKP